MKDHQFCQFSVDDSLIGGCVRCSEDERDTSCVTRKHKFL